MTLHVAAVHPSAELYGSDRMFLATVQALVQHGHRVTAVVPTEGPLVLELQAAGASVEVDDFPVLRKVNMRPTRAPGFAVRMAAAVPRLARRLRRWQVDVVYTNTVIAPVWVAAARMAKIPAVCHVHEQEPDMSDLKKRVLLRPLGLAQRVIANSYSTAHWIADHTGSADVAVVHNGVTPPHGVTAAALPGTAAKHLIVVGRINERKGQRLAVQAVHRLRSLGFDVDLTIVGDIYPGYEDQQILLSIQIASLNMTEHVHQVGFQPDSAAWIAAADVVLVPSQVESFGLVAVEGMLAGKPVVVSAIPALTELVAHEETGYVVPILEGDEWAGQIAAVLHWPDEAAEVAQRARATALERFSMDRYARDVVPAIVGTA